MRNLAAEVLVDEACRGELGGGVLVVERVRCAQAEREGRREGDREGARSAWNGTREREAERGGAKKKSLVKRAGFGCL